MSIGNRLHDGESRIQLAFLAGIYLVQFLPNALRRVPLGILRNRSRIELATRDFQPFGELLGLLEQVITNRNRDLHAMGMSDYAISCLTVLATTSVSSSFWGASATKASTASAMALRTASAEELAWRDRSSSNASLPHSSPAAFSASQMPSL